MIRAILLLVLCLPSLASAQFWRGLGRGPVSPGGATSLFADTILDVLICGGSFNKIMNDEDTVLVIGTAKWNGESWDSLGHRMTPLSGNFTHNAWFLRFNGELLTFGYRPIIDIEGTVSVGLGRFDPSILRWEPFGCINPSLSGITNLVPKEPLGSLYATGFKGGLCGHPERCVFTYQDGTFQPWLPFDQIPDYHNNYVAFVFEFQGKTYVTGQFRDPLSDGFCSFMRFNGTAWEYVPGWGQHLGNIKDISIRNDTLYVAGTFRSDQGAPGNGIAYFDGTDWNDMGGGLYLEPVPTALAAISMQWFQERLYVGGQFTHAAGVPVNGLARWNGRQWCSIPGERQNVNGLVSEVRSMAVWRDSLYIIGSFQSIDDVPMKQIAQWIGGDAVGDCSLPVAVNEQSIAEDLTLSPNPTNGPLRLQGLPSGAQRVVVRDALGRVAHVQTTNLYQLELGHLPAGTYIVQVVDAGGAVRGQARFVRY
jgi:hypothetical protein